MMGDRARRSEAEARSGTRGRRLFGVLVALVVVGGFVFAFALPGRTYLEQRRDVRRAEQRVQVLEQETAKLDRRAGELQTPEEIERIAREQYGLAKPGETAFAILPPEAPADAPPPPASSENRSLVERAWDTVTFWD
jgi:cell division protein FtsB